MITRNDLQLINTTIEENGDYTIYDLMRAPKNDYDGVLKESTITVEVPIPKLEDDKYQYIDTNGTLEITPSEGYEAMEKVSCVINVPQIQNELLQNKRITESGNYTVQNLMNNSVDYAGISKNSNIIVDIPELDITQISNYPISQNGTQIVPIPTGYDAVDSISLNVNVDTRKTLNYIYFPFMTGKLISQFTKVTTDTDMTVEGKKIIYYISENNSYYYFNLYYNSSTSSVTKTIPAGSRYKYNDNSNINKYSFSVNHGPGETLAIGVDTVYYPSSGLLTYRLSKVDFIFTNF